MIKKSITILTILLSIISNAQTADEINSKAKSFMTKEDYKNAVPLLKKAAELGNAEAQYNYGFCFQNGIEVEKNDSVANIWLEKSAKQGWIDAQFKIAYSYAVGRGLEKDMNQAFYWSVQCGNQGDPECINNVISCYMEGTGVEKSLDSMLVWATKLGALEDLENLKMSGMITGARKQLAIMYRDGNMVEKDSLKSYMWFLIYNESKRDFSILEQNSNIKSIKTLEQDLSDEQKKQAREMAEKVINRKLKNMDNLYKTDL